MGPVLLKEFADQYWGQAGVNNLSPADCWCVGKFVLELQLRCKLPGLGSQSTLKGKKLRLTWDQYVLVQITACARVPTEDFHEPTPWDVHDIYTFPATELTPQSL